MLVYQKISKLFNACRNYSLPKLARFLRHGIERFFSHVSVIVYLIIYYFIYFILLIVSTAAEIGCDSNLISVRISADEILRCLRRMDVSFVVADSSSEPNVRRAAATYAKLQVAYRDI